MSKRQEKIERGRLAQKAFLDERKARQLAIFEHNFAAGLTFYEQIKDKLSEAEVADIESQIAENKEIIEKMKKELGIDATGSEG